MALLAWLDAAVAAQARMRTTVAGLRDEQLAAPSAMPGWSVAHVLTQLTRSGDDHRWMLEGARRDDVRALDTPDQELDPAIPHEPARPGAEVVAGLLASLDRLEATWASLPAERWQAVGHVAGKLRTMEQLLLRRVREVELRHVDLGLGYAVADWPDEFVVEELRRSLTDLPARAEPRQLVAWLLGRADAPVLVPWWKQ